VSCVLTAVEARISEDTPRDRRGVRELRDRLGEAYVIEGRDGPYERTHWEGDLAASLPVLRAVAQRVAASEFPVTLATDCALALAEALAPRVVGLEVCAFHSADDEPTRSLVADRIVDVVRAFSPR
jgi:hypothetical protein